MPAPNPKIVALEKQLGAQTKNLTALQAELDTAADQDDKPLIVQIQSEVVATEILIKSTERRLDAARQRETADGKDARKAENLAAVKVVQDELRRQQHAAPRVVSAVQKLVAELEAMHASGRAGRTALASLIRQLPNSQREQTWELLHGVEGAQALGAFVAGLLQRSGVFDTLAPNSTVRLGRYDIDADSFFVRRTERLGVAVAYLAERANAEI